MPRTRGPQRPLPAACDERSRARSARLRLSPSPHATPAYPPAAADDKCKCVGCANTNGRRPNGPPAPDAVDATAPTHCPELPGLSATGQVFPHELPAEPLHEPLLQDQSLFASELEGLVVPPGALAASLGPEGLGAKMLSRQGSDGAGSDDLMLNEQDLLRAAASLATHADAPAATSAAGASAAARSLAPLAPAAPQQPAFGTAPGVLDDATLASLRCEEQLGEQADETTGVGGGYSGRPSLPGARGSSGLLLSPTASVSPAPTDAIKGVGVSAAAAAAAAAAASEPLKGDRRAHEPLAEGAMDVS